MKRILYIHHGKGIGGAPLSLLYLIRGLDRRRYEPTILCLHRSEASDMFEREGIPTLIREDLHDFSHTTVLWYPWWQWPKLLLRAWQAPATYRAARRFFADHPFDLVHLNTSTLLAFGKAAREAGMKVVWHIREPLASGYLGLRYRIARTIIHRNAHVIIPISHYDASRLIPSDAIHVVYNFVDFEIFDATLSGEPVRRELGLGSAHVVTMLGGINPIKGTKEFVQAAVKVLEHHPETVFLVAGDVPQPGWRNRLAGLSRYEAAIRKAIPDALKDHIRFLGVRRDIPSVLAASDLVCFPSTVPHFARPVIEASAMGKAVIASDLGGPRELVIPGETGLLVPACHPVALANAMRVLIEDDARRLAMGRRGIELAREQFSQEKNTRMVQVLYETLF